MNLKERRLAKGYSVNKLAYIAGVSSSTIRNIEAGVQEPRPDTLKWIEEALSED